MCFPVCFQWFLRVGGASKAPKGRLEGPLGGTLGSKVTTWTHIFAIRIQVRVLSAKSDRFPRRSAAEVGPLELKLRELCIEFCLRVQHALLPLAEVRRIDERSPAADPFLQNYHRRAMLKRICSCISISITAWQLWGYQNIDILVALAP